MTPASCLSRLEKLLGPGQVRSDPAERASYAVDGVLPSAVLLPNDPAEAAEVVRFAAAEKLAVIPCGARTKLGMGIPPSRYDLALDVTRLNQIAHYDPADLTLSVDAGLPLTQLSSVLAAQKQFLPLAVPFFAQTTIGGTIASGVDSPLRQLYGSARDFVIGAEFINGSGALTKSGGRVVKNVTGYDLHKLLIGSLGTLAVITRVNFRTFPLLPTRRGLVASFSSEQGVIELRRRIAASPLALSTLEILSPQMARLFAPINHSLAKPPLAPLGAWLAGSAWHLCAGFEGHPEVCDRYARDLSRLAEETQVVSAHLLDEAEHSTLGHSIGEAVPLLLNASPATVIFKMSLLPSHFDSAFAELREITDRASLPSALFARGSGTVYFALLPVTKDVQTFSRLARAATAVFELAACEGGHAMIPWCPTELKRSVNIWGLPRPDFALMQRVKNVFDPHGILSPGRFCGGL